MSKGLRGQASEHDADHGEADESRAGSSVPLESRSKRRLRAIHASVRDDLSLGQDEVVTWRRCPRCCQDCETGNTIWRLFGHRVAHPRLGRSQSRNPLRRSNGCDGRRTTDNNGRIARTTHANLANI